MVRPGRASGRQDAWAASVADPVDRNRQLGACLAKRAPQGLLSPGAPCIGQRLAQGKSRKVAFHISQRCRITQRRFQQGRVRSGKIDRDRPLDQRAKPGRLNCKVGLDSVYRGQ